MAGAIAIGVLLSVAMTGAWALGRNSGRSGRIDAVWAAATGLACIAAVALGAAHGARAGLVAAFLLIWSGRLSFYLWRRSAHGDDPRYVALKAQWGARADVRLFQFLQLQAVASWPLALSAYFAAASTRPAPDARDVVAALVFIAAVVGEAIADAQMAAFKADPRNRGGICERGLWAWSRHPNYFFEWLGWLGLPIVGVDFGWGLLTLLAPAEIYYLLAHVSGVPPLEEAMRRTRGPAYEAYARRVSVFFPLPPSR